MLAARAGTGDRSGEGGSEPEEAEVLTSTAQEREVEHATTPAEG